MKNPFRRNGSPNIEPAGEPDQPEQRPTLDPAPEVIARLDALSEACRAAPDDMNAQIRLWQAVAGLDRWIFINRGPEDAPRPYGLAAPPGNLISVYSSGARAQEGANADGLVPSGESLSLLAVPMPAAIDWVTSFGQYGVVGIAIDHPRIGAWTPLANLARLRPPAGQS